jgi:hypothetical protein
MSNIVQSQAAVANQFTSENNPYCVLGATAPANSIVLVAVVINENAGNVGVNVDPAGFINIATVQATNAVKLLVYYRVATGADSTTITCNLSRNACCAMMAMNYQGGSTSNWIDVWAQNQGGTTQTYSGTVATNTWGTERWISVLATQNTDVFNNPTNGFSLIAQNNKNPGTASDGITWGMFTRDLPSPTTGPATMSATTNQSRVNAGVIVALQERTPITYIRTGGVVSDQAKVSAAKERNVAKVGQTIVSDTTKILGARASVYNRKNILISNAASIGAVRPAFYTKTGSIKADLSVFSGSKLLVHGATIVRDPLDAIHGVASGKVSTTGNAPFQGAYTYFTPDTTNVHTISLYLKSIDPVRIKITNAGGVFLEASLTIPPTTNWTRQIYTTTIQLLAGTQYRLYVETTQAVATNFWLDGVQVEEGLVASPFTVGAKVSGGGPVGAVLREQKPAGLVMTYIVAPGSPAEYATYQELYDHHLNYTDVMDTEQTYQQVFLAP